MILRMNQEAPVTSPPAPRRRIGLAAAALLITLGSPVFYMIWMNNPFVRSTALPTFALMALALLMGIQAVRCDSRSLTRVLFGLNLAIVVFFVWAFFFLAALPETAAFAALETAPDFTLPDHNGQTVSLRASLDAGPVLLVFYRGFW